MEAAKKNSIVVATNNVNERTNKIFKVRGINKYNGEIYYGDCVTTDYDGNLMIVRDGALYFVDGAEVNICTNDYEDIKEFSESYFTGVYDSNGIAIYTDDMVLTEDNKRGCIDWDEEECCFMIHTLDEMIRLNKKTKCTIISNLLVVSTIEKTMAAGKSYE
jgi:hypothetical protein